jgi:DNA polymerase III epsilon subunit-like protein
MLLAMYLVFDTETSDLPRRWDVPASDVDNWPRVVQIAWVVCDADGNPAHTETFLIQPEGFEISPAATAVHGITTERARQDGVALRPVLDRFAADVARVGELVAHNVDFDVKVMGAELIRAGLPDVLPAKRLRCTMKESTDYCRLPGPYGYKWPALGELYEQLFGEPLTGAHDATTDCLACMRSFFELQRRGVL